MLGCTALGWPGYLEEIEAGSGSRLDPRIKLLFDATPFVNKHNDEVDIDEGIITKKF